MIIIIASTRSSAADIADALGDQRKAGQLIWVSNSPDIRAVRQAISLAGGRAFAVSEFRLVFCLGRFSACFWLFSSSKPVLWVRSSIDFRQVRRWRLARLMSEPVRAT